MLTNEVPDVIKAKRCIHRIRKGYKKTNKMRTTKYVG